MWNIWNILENIQKPLKIYETYETQITAKDYRKSTLKDEVYPKFPKIKPAWEQNQQRKGKAEVRK